MHANAFNISCLLESPFLDLAKSGSGKLFGASLVFNRERQKWMLLGLLDTESFLMMRGPIVYSVGSNKVEETKYLAVRLSCTFEA